MSAAPARRPVTGGADEGGMAARRAIIGWAVRLVRREWRQQLLALILLTVAVGATVVGAAVGVNTPSKAATTGTFGTASHIISLPGDDPNLSADLAAIKNRLGTIDVIETQRVATGSAQPVVLQAQDPNGAYGRPMLALVAGRYPTGPDQVAVTGQVATLFDLHLGGAWRASGRSLRVVGRVENPQNLEDAFADEHFTRFFREVFDDFEDDLRLGECSETFQSDIFCELIELVHIHPLQIGDFCDGFRLRRFLRPIVFRIADILDSVFWIH